MRDSKYSNNGLSTKSVSLQVALINLACSRADPSDSSVSPAERRRAYNNIGSSAACWQTTQWFSYLRLFVWLWSERARERGSLSFFPPFLYSSLMKRKARTAWGQTERTVLVRYKACPIAVRSVCVCMKMFVYACDFYSCTHLYAFVHVQSIYCVWGGMCVWSKHVSSNTLTLHYHKASAWPPAPARPALPLPVIPL